MTLIVLLRVKGSCCCELNRHGWGFRVVVSTWVYDGCIHTSHELISGPFDLDTCEVDGECKLLTRV